MKFDEQKQLKTTLVQQLIDEIIPITDIETGDLYSFYNFEKLNIFYYIKGWIMVGPDNKIIKLYLNIYNLGKIEKTQFELEKELNNKLSKKLLCIRQQKNIGLYKKLLKIISKF